MQQLKYYIEYEYNSVTKQLIYYLHKNNCVT